MPDHFFEFSKRERTGIACLLGLCTVLYALPAVFPLFHQPTPMDTAGFHETATMIAEMMKDTGAAFPDHRYRRRDSFRRNEFHKDTFRKYERVYAMAKPAPASIDINTADTSQLDRLPGIGAVLARRIVTFRERLGGFHNISQVGETFGLADSVFKKIQPFLKLGDVSLRKIDINQTDDKSLAEHPYIDTKLARSIVRYRNAHGPFGDIQALKRVALVDEVIYRKIEPYIKVN